MPTYVFKCGNCGVQAEHVMRMSQSQAGPCCTCGTWMQRDYGAEHAHASADSYSKPLHSDSLAIAPSQVEEHRRLFPDIKIDAQCRPVFEKYSQHDAYLKATGYVKVPNRRGKRRATATL